jgi:hypothetical protein
MSYNYVNYDEGKKTPIHKACAALGKFCPKEIRAEDRIYIMFHDDHDDYYLVNIAHVLTSNVLDLNIHGEQLVLPQVPIEYFPGVIFKGEVEGAPGSSPDYDLPGIIIQMILSGTYVITDSTNHRVVRRENMDFTVYGKRFRGPAPVNGSIKHYQVPMKALWILDIGLLKTNLSDVQLRLSLPGFESMVNLQTFHHLRSIGLSALPAWLIRRAKTGELRPADMIMSDGFTRDLSKSQVSLIHLSASLNKSLLFLTSIDSDFKKDGTILELSDSGEPLDLQLARKFGSDLDLLEFFEDSGIRASDLKSKPFQPWHVQRLKKDDLLLVESKHEWPDIQVNTEYANHSLTSSRSVYNPTKF